MKPSTLALALVTAAPLAAAQHHQQPAGAAHYKRMKTIRGSGGSDAAAARAGLSAPSSPHARLLSSARDEDEAAALAACSAHAASDECAGAGDCTWCESKAVASGCYPSAMTGRLPAGVFACAASSSSSSSSSASVADAVASFAEAVVAPTEGGKGKQSFVLKEGVTLTLDEAEVDRNFCDASSPLSLAGYMNVKGSQFDTKNDKNLFYWFFEKRATSQIPGGNDAPRLGAEDAGETPLVVWLTGGPGCSSSLALLTENGPCSVEDDGATTKVNPHSWTETAHVLWLDQPANVGYSYGQGNDTDEGMISEDAYFFLQAWFKSAQGQKYKDSPLFIVGESYGGHYAPAIAHRIWRGNKDLQPGLATLNLKGLAVGNGLTDPEEQYKWYAEMAFKNSHNNPVIDESTYNTMKKAEPMCTKGIHQCNKGDNLLDSFACQAAFMYCNMALTTPYRMTGKNPYDIRKPCGDNPLCYDFSHIEKFMNDPNTKRALHVDEHNPSWQTCNMAINMEFHVDWMKNFAPYVADLLNDGVPALIYAGDVDFVCNYLGNRAWTLNLDWKHKAEFQAAQEKDWNAGGGLARSSNGLTFLQVYDAGHMVPTDQPEHALKMITQFLNGEAF